MRRHVSFRALRQFRGTSHRREACGVHARRTAERIDFQAAVVGQHPAVQVGGLLRGLQSGIGGKRITILDHFNRIWNVFQRDDCETPRHQQLRQFLALLAIVRADNQWKSRVKGQITNWLR